MITDGYRKQQAEIHRTSNFGANSRSKTPKVFNIPKVIKENKIETLFDFGCGQGGLHTYLKKQCSLKVVNGYDPCVEKYNVLPEGTFDMVTSIDVLEHVEPEFIVDTLKLINNKFTKIAFLNIHTAAASRILPDGRNAHLIQKQPEWWKEKITKFIDGEIIEERWLPYNERKHNGPVNYLFIISKK